MKLRRKTPKNPLPSKYEGFCKVCGKSYYVGELISPYFDQNYNLWRHTNCYQFFYIDISNSKECKQCAESIEENSCGYWSIHNGVWCIQCAENLAPKVTIAYSRNQKEFRKRVNEDE